MEYEELLKQEPFGVSQKEKEVWFYNYFTELTAYHKEHCPAYAKLLSALQVPEAFSSMSQIPMMPVSAFKDMKLRSVEEEDVFKVITSSGTTGKKVSEIYLDEETAANQQKTLVRIMEEVIGKRRIPMLIADSPEVLQDRNMFTARGAGILGFSIVSSRHQYAFNKDMNLDVKGIEAFLEKYKNGPILVFGFTYMIWKYFYGALKESEKKLSIPNGIMIHGGGWKKLQAQAVSMEDFKKGIQEVSEIKQVYDYYGMAEQTGCIYLECEYGHLHASTYSDILIRNMQDFSVCEIGTEGTIQVLSPMARSYPGHSILTEDQGILLGIDDCPCGKKGKYFKVTGRMQHAEVRGCSDTYEG